jgi:hypothetical protein
MTPVVAAVLVWGWGQAFIDFTWDFVDWLFFPWIVVAPLSLFCLAVDILFLL